MDNLTVVETDDVLYIGDLQKSQNVKKIVEKLKEKKISLEYYKFLFLKIKMLQFVFLFIFSLQILLISWSF